MHLQKSMSRESHRVSAVFTPSERLVFARESSCCLLIPVSYIPHIISPPATESLGDSAGAWSGQWADASLPRSRTDSLAVWLLACTAPSLLSTRGKLHFNYYHSFHFIIEFFPLFWCTPACVCHGVLCFTGRIQFDTTIIIIIIIDLSCLRNRPNLAWCMRTFKHCVCALHSQVKAALSRL